MRSVDAIGAAWAVRNRRHGIVPSAGLAAGLLSVRVVTILKHGETLPLAEELP